MKQKDKKVRRQVLETMHNLAFTLLINFGCEASILYRSNPHLQKSGKSYGANVILTGENFDEAWTALMYAWKKKSLFIHLLMMK